MTSPKGSWNKRAHFCVTPARQLNNWIPRLLQEWPSTLDGVKFTAKAQTKWEPRLDGRWPWMQSISSVLGTSRSFPLVDFGDGCSKSPNGSFSGSIALVSRQVNSTCYWSKKFLNAQRAGAAGVIVYSDPNVPLIDINCRKPSCYLVDIPVTMVSNSVGLTLLRILKESQPVAIQFTAQSSDGLSFAIDCSSMLQEMGTFQYPSMSFLAWEAQYFDYYRDLLTTIDASTVPETEDFVVNVFNNVSHNYLYSPSL